MRLLPRLVCAAVVVALNIASAHAQDAGVKAPLDKAQRKEWKKKLKGLTPESYKALTEANATLTAERDQKAKDIVAMQARFTADQEELARLKANFEAASAPAPNTEDASKEAYEARHKEVSKGVIYKVQIGSFRNKDLSKYLDNNQNFSGDTDTDGIRKYTLGYFGNYWEADNFKKYLREMGVHDAWTVAYRDGKRIPLKDVLEGGAGDGVGMN